MQVYGITKQRVQKKVFDLASSFLNEPEVRSNFPSPLIFLLSKETTLK